MVTCDAGDQSDLPAHDAVRQRLVWPFALLIWLWLLNQPWRLWSPQRLPSGLLQPKKNQHSACQTRLKFRKKNTQSTWISPAVEFDVEVMGGITMNDTENPAELSASHGNSKTKQKTATKFEKTQPVHSGAIRIFNHCQARDQQYMQ